MIKLAGVEINESDPLDPEEKPDRDRYASQRYVGVHWRNAMLGGAAREEVICAFFEPGSLSILR